MGAPYIYDISHLRVKLKSKCPKTKTEIKKGTVGWEISHV